MEVDPCRYARVHVKIDADFDIAPINSHHILPHLTEILKQINELDRIHTSSKIESCISLDFIPVRKEDLPRTGDGP